MTGGQEPIEELTSGESQWQNVKNKQRVNKLKQVLELKE